MGISLAHPAMTCCLSKICTRYTITAASLRSSNHHMLSDHPTITIPPL